MLVFLSVEGRAWDAHYSIFIGKLISKRVILGPAVSMLIIVILLHDFNLGDVAHDEVTSLRDPHIEVELGVQQFLDEDVTVVGESSCVLLDVGVFWFGDFDEAVG